MQKKLITDGYPSQKIHKYYPSQIAIYALFSGKLEKMRLIYYHVDGSKA
jgi:hypothetical protein